MARRIEISVVPEYAEFIHEVLENKLEFKPGSPKPHAVTELAAKEKIIFYVTVPSGALSNVLEILKKEGVGVGIGTVAISTLDAFKPRFKPPAAPAAAAPTAVAATDGAPAKPKPTSTLQGFRDFQKARLTTEEIYNNILTQATMTMNTWFNLIGASIMAAGGLTSNVTVFVVAAMLVSPIMGPILGMTFGLRVADWRLFKMSCINEFKMATTAFSCGALVGVLLGSYGETYSWPTSGMMETGKVFNLVISIIVSLAAGTVLAVSVTAGGVNSLVGTAISAGLLPPIVNAGMMISYAAFYAPKGLAKDMFSMGVYALVYYATHVGSIIVVANFIFWLKEINPNFKSVEDNSYLELASVQEYNKRLEAKKAAGASGFATTGLGATAEFFFGNVRNELGTAKNDASSFVGGVTGAVSDFAGGVTGAMSDFAASMGLISSTRARRNSSAMYQAPGVGDVEMAERSSGPSSVVSKVGSVGSAVVGGVVGGVSAITSTAGSVLLSALPEVPAPLPSNGDDDDEICDNHSLSWTRQTDDEGVVSNPLISSADVNEEV